MNEMTTTITDTYNAMPAEFSELNPEQLQQIIMMVKADDYKKQVRQHIKKTEFNVERTINEWLCDKPYDTARMYRLYVNNFISYLDGTSLLDVDKYAVDNFNKKVLSTFGNAKAKLVLASLSTCYSVLERWNHIDDNPGEGVQWKKQIEFPVEKHIPSEEDMNRIKSKYDEKTHSGRKMLLALHILETYGCRVGFFNPSLEYDGKHLDSVSKGKPYRINVENGSIIEENKDILCLLNKDAITSSFRRIVKKMYGDGELKHLHSIHSYRHAFACRLYIQTKDIYLVSKKLKHTSISVTEVYLKGLNIL